MSDVDGVAITVVAARELSPTRRDALHRLFEESYAQADHDYLESSLELLRFVALGVVDGSHDRASRSEADESIAGFALGESRTIDLPGLPAQRLALAGLCCVKSSFRREGLFRSLERRAITEGMGPLDAGRLLAAGRMAHPASMRIMRASPTALPRPGIAPSVFHQEVACAVAACYGVEAFDPHTFICHGHGRPIGYPRMTVEAATEEWELFSEVDRDSGDSLLALCWIPDAPPGW